MRSLKCRRRSLILNSLAPSTVRIRTVQWNCYLRFCKKFGLEPLPCSDNQLSLLASFLSKHMTFGSVSNYLQAVVWVHRLKGLKPPSVSSDLVHMTMTGLKRVSRPPVPKDPITFKHLKKMYYSLNLSSPLHVMFWSCILTLFRTLLRVSHVVDSPHVLLRRDVVFPPGGGMLVNVHSSKTKLPGSNHIIPVSELSNSNLCAVYWVKKWISMYNHSPSDPLFTTPNGLSYSMFRVALSRLLKAAGIKANLSSHSFRRGGATFLSAVGFPLSALKERGGWASDAVFKYINEPTYVKMARDVKVSKIIDVITH